MGQTGIRGLSPVSNDRGIALITALIMLIIISVLGIYGINSSVIETWRSSNYRAMKQAFYAADAGIEDGISRLVSGVVSDSGSETSTDWNNGLTYTSSNFSNTLTIQHRSVGNPQVVGTSSGSTQYLITSIGTSGSARRTIEAVITLVRSSNSPFTDAMTGCEGVTIASNGRTSSYSSSGQPADGYKGNLRTTNADADITFSSNADIRGEVNATGDIIQASNAVLRRDVRADGNITMSGNADIVQNALSGGAITMSNNAVIQGNATAAGSISQTNNAHINGTQTPDSPPESPLVPTQVCDPLGVTTLFGNANSSIGSSNNNNELSTSYYSGGAYSIGGNDNSTLGAADQTRRYYFSSFSMSSNSRLSVSGNVTLYVNGNFTLSSNTQITLATGASLTIYDTGTFTLNSNTTINNSGLPQNLTLYSNAASSTHSDYRVNLNSNSGIRGVVYAPNAAITINSNSDLYGAVRGGFINMASNAEFHYDEDLANVNFGGTQTITGYNLVSWQQKF